MTFPQKKKKKKAKMIIFTFFQTLLGSQCCILRVTGSLVSEKKFFKVFTIYGYGGHLERDPEVPPYTTPRCGDKLSFPRLMEAPYQI